MRRAQAQGNVRRATSRVRNRDARVARQPAGLCDAHHRRGACTGSAPRRCARRDRQATRTAREAPQRRTSAEQVGDDPADDDAERNLCAGPNSADRSRRLDQPAAGAVLLPLPPTRSPPPHDVRNWNTSQQRSPAPRPMHEEPDWPDRPVSAIKSGAHRAVLLTRSTTASDATQGFQAPLSVAATGIVPLGGPVRAQDAIRQRDVLQLEAARSRKRLQNVLAECFPHVGGRAWRSRVPCARRENATPARNPVRIRRWVGAATSSSPLRRALRASRCPIMRSKAPRISGQARSSPIDSRRPVPATIADARRPIRKANLSLAARRASKRGFSPLDATHRSPARPTRAVNRFPETAHVLPLRNRPTTRAVSAPPRRASSQERLATPLGAPARRLHRLSTAPGVASHRSQTP